MSRRRRAGVLRLAAIVACAASALAACGDRRPKVDPGALVIGDKRAVKIGPVGLDAEADTTYALVDVTNTGGRDVIAAIGGELVDRAGNPLGRVRPETLRIDAGATRMFALVDERGRVLDNAAGVAVEIRGASVAHAESRLAVTHVRNDVDQGRAVVAGYLENSGDGDVVITVIGAFYDAGGAPVGRDAVLYPIDRRSRRAVQHVGPRGSARGDLFVGDGR